MIVFDTNVISELTRSYPSPAVISWARVQEPAAIFTTAVSEAELLYGIALMPGSRRRADLARAAEAMFGIILGGRVLPFDRAAAAAYADWAASCRHAGKVVGMADLQIAAIARVRGATAIATRNTHDFVGCGVPLVDPWQTT